MALSLLQIITTTETLPAQPQGKEGSWCATCL